MKRQRIKVLAAGVAALSLVVAACGSDEDGTSSETDSTIEGVGDCETVDEVSLQLQWFTQAQFAGYYAAKEKGFYEAMCLDVTKGTNSNCAVESCCSVDDAQSE